MDYNTEKVAKIINLYLLLATNEVSYVRNELGKLLKDNLLPALDDEDFEDSEISDVTRQISNECQSFVENISLIQEKDNRNDKILKEITSTAADVSNYYDKPLVCQLVCIWYIFSSTDNTYKKQAVDLLNEQWNVKDDLLAEIADIAETLAELKENCQLAISCTPKNSFFTPVKNFFRKNKIPDRKKVVEDEYRNDETVLLESVKQLFATEAVKS